jgi:HlyD family secretion protein
VSGVVTHRPVEVGELVAPGGVVAVLSKLDRLHLTIYVTAVEMGRIRLVQEAEVRIDADPGRAFPGRVVYLSPEAEFTPRNVQTKEDRVKLVFGVKIEVDNPDGALKPGLPADATIR